MNTTLQDIEAVIAEAEFIRSRHEGVHVVHSLVTVLHICRELHQGGAWRPRTAQAYHDAVRRMRYLDRTGFLPHERQPDLAAGGERDAPLEPVASEAIGRSLSVLY